ncbi:hypothetical protein WH8501_27160 [Crocosphaera watsonii WH 8501]|uniref:Uncharacterized protein n=2 Tax=Crocosphaera watsonii TaxID=263511 RepID=G5J7W1_CROWT|nr:MULTISPECIES: hypothetical protein [Crocosphaera]EHJ11696.1 hypothetical protein CWATWH0003_3547 [Crocosphaera watsonii WH 0003]MCH2244184.1 hypothetical protein [Crocosphaera sp.]NQZ62630.1 hypothetical protein [Crocosphaera sp.]CCQ53574.1 FIG00556873: hypothetical protein [Crocosphaera watsonii WH 8502]
MNQVIDKTLRFINLWSKIEIIAALVLTVIILGYAVCPNRSQKANQSLEITPSTTQP